MTSSPARESTVIGSTDKTSSVGDNSLFRSTSSPLTFAAKDFFRASRSKALIASATVAGAGIARSFSPYFTFISLIALLVINVKSRRYTVSAPQRAQIALIDQILTIND